MGDQLCKWPKASFFTDGGLNKETDGEIHKHIGVVVGINC